jgi:tetrahydromethanopterin S-methyltransferase subunit A
MYETPDYSEAEFIDGKYDDLKDWVYDTKGYFLIRVNKEKERIEAGYCKQKNKVLKVVYGTRASDIYYTLAQLYLVSRLDHASYLGKELTKAELALKNGLEYVQDEELQLK